MDDLKKIADWLELFALFVPAGLLAAGLPANSLVVADAGFIGFDLCRRLQTDGVRFLLRVGANVTLLTVGADASITGRTAQQPVVGFVLTNSGLMGSLSLSGSRITPLNLN